MPEAISTSTATAAHHNDSTATHPLKQHAVGGVSKLQVQACLGFSGRVNQSLILHPDGEHLIYAVGSAVVIRNKNDAHGFQHILQGHSNSITCLAVSKSGRYIASGQQTHMGYQADIIIWDFETKQLHKRCTLHKVQVLSLAFSPNDKYLASIGGQDDNTVVVWDIVKGVAICGAKASKDTAGPTTCLGYFNNSDDKLVTAGNQVIRVWDVDPVNKKLHVHDCQLGQIKRVVNVVRVSADDQWLYCGTTTGDLLQINLHSYLFTQSGPSKSKDLFSLGITAIHPGKEEILVGCGDGTIASLRTDTLHTQQQCKVDGCVSSLFSDAANGQIVVATDKSNIYHLPHSGATAKLDSPKLVSGCHSVCINKFCFPDNCSDLFATASNDDVRVWNIHNQKELLRLAVPNVSCHSIVFKRDGTSIITGWSDGKIRAFGPESGRLQYCINDTHKGAVTALAVTQPINHEGQVRLISGGDDGQVRVWLVGKDKQKLETSMKEHKDTVTAIKLRQNDKECVSSSIDGSCISWDLIRGVRNMVMFAPTFFTAVAYYPEECQLITCGTDHKVCYWEAFDGSLVRELEVSDTDVLASLDVTVDGKYFVCGGSDKVVRVFRYDEGDAVATGHGHSSDITCIRISPDQKRIVSVSKDGAVFVWKFPFPVGAALHPPQIAL